MASVTYVSEDSMMDQSYLDDEELNDDLAGTLSEISDKEPTFLASNDEIFEECNKNLDKPRLGSVLK